MEKKKLDRLSELTAISRKRELTEEEKNEYKCKNYINRDFRLEWANMKDFEKMRRENIKEQLQKLFKSQA